LTMRVRSSPRWSARLMTEPSAVSVTTDWLGGAPPAPRGWAGGAWAGAGVSAGRPGSRAASASAMKWATAGYAGGSADESDEDPDGAVGAAGVVGAAGATGARGAGSSDVASWTSDAALRNSRMLLPSAAPTSGSLPGPRTRSAITRTMISSTGPIPNGMAGTETSMRRWRRDAAGRGRPGDLR